MVQLGVSVGHLFRARSRDVGKRINLRSLKANNKERVIKLFKFSCPLQL